MNSPKVLSNLSRATTCFAHNSHAQVAPADRPHLARRCQVTFFGGRNGESVDFPGREIHDFFTSPNAFLPHTEHARLANPVKYAQRSDEGFVSCSRGRRRQGSRGEHATTGHVANGVNLNDASACQALRASDTRVRP